MVYGVILYIADKAYYGEGFNRQKAKHSAAYQALQYLSTLKIPEKSVDIVNEKEDSTKKNTIVEIKNENDATEANASIIIPKNVQSDLKNEKSEISLVQEQAHRRNLRDKYEVRSITIFFLLISKFEKICEKLLLVEF